MLGKTESSRSLKLRQNQIMLAVDELTNNPFVDYKSEYEKLLLLK